MRWFDRARREAEDPPFPRPARHGRHGRLGRSPITKPPLPGVGSRYDLFSIVVTSTADFLRATWPELRDVRFEISSMPVREDDAAVPRWTVDTANNLVIVHRVPVERLDRAHGLPLHRTDDFHKRILIEGAVFGGAAEYLGREPWELGADPFH